MYIRNFINILNKNRNLGFKTFEIHGINPKLIYEPTGKEIELPRFSSVEMQQARIMNRHAILQSRTALIRTYPKASKQDLARLTSQTIEDTYSRVEWLNPKDGEIYNLLKQGETKDGKIIVRILDGEGAFIKEAQISPKTILIPDNYTDPTSIFGIPHGELTLTYAKRNNPFAKYVKLQLSQNDLTSKKDFEQIAKYLNDGNEADYISCSYGTKVYYNKKFKNPDNLKSQLEEFQKYDSIAKDRRILFSADNATENDYNNISEVANRYLLGNQKVEGVGALNHGLGKIAIFSLSRNSSLTQHYELGEFYPKVTKNGLNITELPGTDLPFPNKKLEKIAQNPLIGKPVKKVQQLILKINARITDLEKEKFSLFKQRKSIMEILKSRSRIEKQIELYQQRKKKILSYSNDLRNEDGIYNIPFQAITGTSFATPIRTAKLALNDMMEGII